MADEVTVVKVKRVGGCWVVEFSDPVNLDAWSFDPKFSTKWVACLDDDPFEPLETDELGAFVWALKVIEKNKEMQHAQDA